MKSLRIALLLLGREWRARELHLLTLALITAIAAFTMVNFFTSRLQTAVLQQNAQLLGGDIIIQSTRAIPTNWHTYATQHDLKHTEILYLLSMLSTADKAQLVNIKVVSAPYPLRGEIKLSTLSSQQSVITTAIPTPGEVWVEPRLLSLMQLHLGETIQLGEAHFKITAIIENEPDVSGNWLNVAPRVLLNKQDLARTQLLQPGSRVQYNWALMGSHENLQHFEAWIKPQLAPTQSLITARSGRTQLSTLITRTLDFAQLLVLVTLVLAGVAIQSAAKRYCERHYDTVSLLRVFGLTPSHVFVLYAWQIMIGGLAAIALGALAGYSLHFVFLRIFAPFLKIALASSTWMPLWSSIWVGFLLLSAFVLPAFLNLSSITPTRIFSRDIPLQSRYIGLQTSLLFLLLAYIYFNISNPLLFRLFIGCLALAYLLMLLISTVVFRSIHRLPTHLSSPWRYGLTYASRQSNASKLQIAGFSLIVFLMSCTWILRDDLLTHWQQQLPTETPNYFMINLQPTQLATFNTWFKEANAKNLYLYPILKGRLQTRNGINIRKGLSEEEQQHNSLKRELNLTWTTLLPKENEILEGRWFTAIKDKDELPQISVEKELADTLHFKLGDIITLQIAEKIIKGEITSIRKVAWDAFTPNFYIIFDRDISQQLPLSYMASFYLPASQKSSINTLVEMIPLLIIFDVVNLIAQVQEIAKQISQAIFLLGGLALIVAALVFLTTLENSLDIRRHEMALFRLLGASNHYLRYRCLSELLTIGLIASLTGSLSSIFASKILSNQLLDLHYQPDWLMLICLITAATLAIVSIGMLRLRTITNISPLWLLRNTH